MAKKVLLTGDRPTGQLHIGHYAVYSILEKGSAKANQVAQQTLSEVRAAIGINYFG